VEDDLFEPDAALRPELRVLRAVPVEVLHCQVRLSQCVLDRHTAASAPVCPPVRPNGKWQRLLRDNRFGVGRPILMVTCAQPVSGY
jgi:hypothetical protein